MVECQAEYGTTAGVPGSLAEELSRERNLIHSNAARISKKVETGPSCPRVENHLKQVSESGGSLQGFQGGDQEDISGETHRANNLLIWATREFRKRKPAGPRACIAEC